MIYLRNSQVEAAKFLEICYLQLKDHPDEASKIRLTATEARMQHGMCSGLMKQFMTTSEFVADQMMPMMRKVIKKRKSKIISAMLEEVLQMAEGMKREAESVRDRYMKLTSKLQDNIADVNKRNHEVVQQSKELEIQRGEAETLERQARKEQEDMAKERQETLAELQRMRKKRDELLASAISSETDDETWKGLMEMSVPKVVLPSDIINTGLVLAKIPLHLIRQGIKTYGVVKQGQQTQDVIDKEEKKQSKLREQLRERQETTLERLAQIKRIDLKRVTLGDVKSLLEALKQLAQVDEMFQEIVTFWDNMTVFLKSLHSKTGAGKSFLKAIKTKKYAKMFGETITKAEGDWRKFGTICRAYAMQADQDTKNVYQVLSKPVDLMDDSERQMRVQTLTDDIEQNLKQLEY